MALGATTPESRSLADLSYYQPGQTGSGYKALSARESVIRKPSYLVMAESHYNRAESIVTNGGNWKEFLFAMQSSWYYLLCAAECGEL